MILKHLLIFPLSFAIHPNRDLNTIWTNYTTDLEALWIQKAKYISGFILKDTGFLRDGGSLESFGQSLNTPNFGCWCNSPTRSSVIRGTPLDEFDSLCKKFHGCLKCSNKNRCSYLNLSENEITRHPMEVFEKPMSDNSAILRCSIDRQAPTSNDPVSRHCHWAVCSCLKDFFKNFSALVARKFENSWADGESLERVFDNRVVASNEKCHKNKPSLGNDPVQRSAFIGKNEAKIESFEEAFDVISGPKQTLNWNGKYIKTENEEIDTLAVMSIGGDFTDYESKELQEVVEEKDSESIIGLIQGKAGTFDNEIIDDEIQLTENTAAEWNSVNVDYDNSFQSMDFDVLVDNEKIERTASKIVENSQENNPSEISITTESSLEENPESVLVSMIQEQIDELEDDDFECCGSLPNWQPYSSSNSESCCAKTVYNIEKLGCCGRDVFNRDHHQCCAGNKVGDLNTCDAISESSYQLPQQSLEEMEEEDDADSTISSEFESDSDFFTYQDIPSDHDLYEQNIDDIAESLIEMTHAEKQAARKLRRAAVKKSRTEMRRYQRQHQHLSGNVIEEPVHGDDNIYTQDQQRQLYHESNDWKKKNEFFGFKLSTLAVCVPELPSHGEDNKEHKEIDATQFCLGVKSGAIRYDGYERTKFLWPDRSCRYYVDCEPLYSGSQVGVSLSKCKKGARWNGVKCDYKFYDEDCAAAFNGENINIKSEPFGMLFSTNYDWTYGKEDYAENMQFHSLQYPHECKSLDLSVTSNEQCDQRCNCFGEKCRGCQSDNIYSTIGCRTKCTYDEATAPVSKAYGSPKDFFCKYVMKGQTGFFPWVDWTCKTYIGCARDVDDEKNIKATIYKCDPGYVFSITKTVKGVTRHECVKQNTKKAKQCGNLFYRMQSQYQYMPSWGRYECFLQNLRAKIIES